MPGLPASEQLGVVTVAGSSMSLLLEAPATSSARYVVSFVEQGLGCAAGPPTACAWQIGLNGTVVRSNGSATLQLLLANGTYGYAARAAGYEWLSALTGAQVTVAGRRLQPALLLRHAHRLRAVAGVELLHSRGEVVANGSWRQVERAGEFRHGGVLA